MTLRALRSGSLLAAIVLLTGSGDARGQTLRIGIIDFYGLRRVSEASVRPAVAVKEGDTISIEGGGRPRFLDDSERQLSAVPGVLRAHAGLVCCDDGRAILYVGIEETGAQEWQFRSPPDGNARLPADVVRTESEFSNAMVAAIQRGDAAEEVVDGVVLMHDPAARAIQRRFIDHARDLSVIRDVLRHSSDADQRALAAQVLGYAANPRDVLDDLSFAIDDPSESVRNNAIRAVWTMARAHPGEVSVPFEPLVRLLSSPHWTDRNKSSAALLALAKPHDAALLDALRRGAMPSLVEMARWKSKGHAMAAFLMLGRIGGHSDDEAEAAWDRGDREAIIRDALRR